MMYPSTEVVSSQVAAPELAAAAPARFFNRGLVVWTMLGLALLSFGVFGNSLKNGFALDDIAIVRDNPKVLNLEWSEIWTSNYWPREQGMSPDILYRPITLWSYLANQAIAPGKEWPFHLVNVLLHVLVTLLAVGVAWRVFGHRGIALLSGLFFALHPLHTEVVANVVGRAELLGALFSLLAILTYLPPGPVLAAKPHDGRAWWAGILPAVCFFLALLSKETPVALLIAFPVVDVWRWSLWNKSERPTLFQWIRRQTLRFYIPLSAAFAVYFAMRINACGLMRNIEHIHPVVNPLVRATMLERLITPFAILAKYLQLSFWPRVLVADYSAPSFMPTSNLLSPLPLLGFLVTVLGCLVMVRGWKKVPSVVLTVILFVFSYALVANFLRIGTIMGERLFYLPSLFVLMLVAYCGWHAYQAARGKRLVRGLLVLILAGLVSVMSWRTYDRNTDWESNNTLAIATARDNTNSAKACFWAGTVLVYDEDNPKWKSFAAELFQRSVDLYPTFGQGYFELAKMKGRDNEVGESLVYLVKAAQFDGGKYEVHWALTGIKSDLKSQDPASYMPLLEKFAKDNPKDAPPQLALAIAYSAQEKWKEAATAANAALEIDPLFHEAACELALVDQKTGHPEAAVVLMRRYLQNVPNTTGRCELAHALMALDPVKYPRAFDEAVGYINEARAVDPDNPRLKEMDKEINAFKRNHAGTAQGQPKAPAGNVVAAGGAS